ncbi:MAG: hypothetical protein CL878_12395 [Dehalococcoidia bacterium]|nr:hypothetical protein [Dehalococcoidia bacterium]
MADTEGPPAEPADEDAAAEEQAPATAPQRLHPYIDPPRYEQHLDEEHGLVVRPKAGEIVAIPEHQMWLLAVKDQYQTKKGKTLQADAVLRETRGRRPYALGELYRFIHPDDTTQEQSPIRRGRRPPRR